MSFKSEFKIKNFALKHDDSNDFYCMQFWCVPRWIIWCLRVIFTVYHLSTLLFSIIVHSSRIWPVFLTNWTMVIMLVYFIWITALSGMFGLNLQFESLKDQNVDQHTEIVAARKEIPWHVKLFWAWYNVTYVITIVTDLMYWGFVYQPSHFDTFDMRFSNINDHSALLAMLLIDFTFHRIPVHLYHVVYSIVVAVIYLMVSIIYTLSSGRYVYKVLNWKDDAGKAVFFFFIALLLAVIIQIVMYGLYRLKIRIKNN
ncbi:protein rolling stone-like [Hydractinia symbiolongicarpus]|uniref:protein rolling stone-like n=1 Tax=Hydractinia symbiolongicarpus TaxID=13093 RepID=UPI00254FB7F2|nr:protein rolling stone-like [Hydractinia symbiolongicarpus]